MKKLAAWVTTFFAIMGIEAMYISEKFIPIYVNGEFIRANRIIRLALYGLLLVVIVYCLSIIIAKSNKKHHSKRRRPRRRK